MRKEYRKSISYAYPSSTVGKKTGGYFVGVYSLHFNDAGECVRSQVEHENNAELFDSYDDPDLIALYHEAAGEPCPYAMRHHREWQPVE